MFILVLINLFTEFAEISNDKMNFDELLVILGEFGAYQKCVYFLICLLSVSSGVHTIISVFLLGIPDHRSVWNQNEDLVQQGTIR